MTDVKEISRLLKAWEQGINDRVVERQREARGVVIAALAKAHHLQLGPPGTAKSYLITTSLSLLDGAKSMEILLHGYSVMEDLYGPISMKGLDEDRWLRQTDGFLPTADFIFADEIFKANPTLLNTNLWAFNERKFRNDGSVTQIPLCSAFLASNEGPEDPILQAFDDRIHLRYVVGPIKETASRLAMFKMRLDRAKQGKPEPILSMDDLRAGHELVPQVVVPDSVQVALNNLWEELGKAHVHVTDRKIGDALGIIQATAVYNGRMTASIEDMRTLRDMLWSNEKDRPVVAEKIHDLATPLDKEAQIIVNGIEGLAANVEEIIAIEQRAIRVRRGVQLHNKLADANRELAELKTRAEAEGYESEIVQEGRQRLHNLTKRLLDKGFGVTKPSGELDSATLAKLIKEMKETEE